MYGSFIWIVVCALLMTSDRAPATEGGGDLLMLASLSNTRSPIPEHLRQMEVVNRSPVIISDIFDLDAYNSERRKVIRYLRQPIRAFDFGQADFRDGSNRCVYNLLIILSDGSGIPVSGIDICERQPLHIELTRYREESFRLPPPPFRPSWNRGSLA